MTEIRPATMDDAEAIRAIYNDAVLNTTAVFDYVAREPQAQRDWLQMKADQKLPVLVATDGGTVVGFSSYGQFRPWPAFLYTVENAIYIASDRRGQGIGQKLAARTGANGRGSDRAIGVAGDEQLVDIQFTLDAVDDLREGCGLIEPADAPDATGFERGPQRQQVEGGLFIRMELTQRCEHRADARDRKHGFQTDFVRGLELAGLSDRGPCLP